SGGVARCANRTVYAAALEAAVWAQVCALLAQPERLAAEYERRLAAAEERPLLEGALRAELAQAQRGVARLIDSYAEGVITKEEFIPRVGRLRQRIRLLSAQLAQQQACAAEAADMQRTVGRLAEFAQRVRARLEEADEATKREIIVALVKR